MTIPKTLDNFKIVYKDGTQIDMADDLSVLVKSFVISAPNPIIYKEKIEGSDGSTRLGKEFGERRISATCSFFGTDVYDYHLLRNELFRSLMARETFYVISDAEPGKRWEVEVSTEWDPTKIGSYGDFSIEFTSFSTYAESIGTTLDPKTFDAQLWQTGGGLTLDETMYTHSTTSFQIYNAADGVTINPRQMPLEITFKGASSNLTITNTTTGDVWQYIKTTASGDTLLLTGVRSLKNGLSVFSDTNKKLISLAPGYSNFTITGATGSFTISFSFRFYTL